MSLLNLTNAPEGGWTKEELKIRMDQLLDNIIESSQYGDKAIIEEEDSKIEIQNLQKTLKDSYLFLQEIYKNIQDDVMTPEDNNIKNKRTKRKRRLDFDI